MTSKQQPIHLVCGVPASGKSWVLQQLRHLFTVIENDKHIGRDYVGALLQGTKNSDKPILADCPFGEQELIDKLRKKGLEVHPIFIIVSPELVKERYKQRGKPVPPMALSRAQGIKKTAMAMHARYGDSNHVLRLLREIGGAK